MRIPKCPTCGADYKVDTTAYTPNCECHMLISPVQVVQPCNQECNKLRAELTEVQEREKVLRDALKEIYDNAQFEEMYCQKCGDSEPMKDCDYVSIAAKALAHET